MCLPADQHVVGASQLRQTHRGGDVGHVRLPAGGGDVVLPAGLEVRVTVEDRPVEPVQTQPFYLVGELVIVGRDHAAFAGRDAFGGVEREEGRVGVAARADHVERVAVDGREGVGGVIDQLDAVLVAELPSASVLQEAPPKCVGITTLVCGVIFAATSSTLIWYEPGSQSASTTLAPSRCAIIAGPENVIAGTITSVPGPTPSASSVRRAPAVALLTAIAWPHLTVRANAASNSWTLRPLVSQPDSRHSVTAATSAREMSGSAKGKTSMQSNLHVTLQLIA